MYSSPGTLLLPGRPFGRSSRSTTKWTTWFGDCFLTVTILGFIDCYRDEDWCGHMKNLAKNTHARRGHERTLQRYKLLLSVLWHDLRHDVEAQGFLARAAA